MKRRIRLLLLIVITLYIINFAPIDTLLETAPVPVAAAEQSTTLVKNPFPLILDSKTVDYMSYVPEIKCSSSVKEALSIEKPSIKVEAASAMLLNSDGNVLYYKYVLKPVFPGSTAKLLTALVAVDWCSMKDEIKVGKEVGMITEDASVAGLKKGEVLNTSTLLSAMLLPSGNDAAYVMAAYVGRKSLKNPKASCEAAINEFVRLMNEKAKELGAENSCFITPDGYDAIGQYTTTYDLGMIGLAASKSKIITGITKKRVISVNLISGEKLTWENTNLLLNRNSEWYNPNVIGLKTGTTTMAGKCLISAAKNDQGTVISIVMNSTSKGRWSDSNKLLNYALKTLKLIVR